MNSNRLQLTVEGHRGYRPLENSIDAFKIAFDTGVDGIETDIWLSKDNYLFIHHGKTELGLLKLLDLESGESKLMHAKDICKEDFERFVDFSTKRKLVFLSSLLELVRNYPNIYLNLEFKDQSSQAMREMGILLTKVNPPNKIFFSSFIHSVKQNQIEHWDIYPILKTIGFGFCCHNLIILEQMKSLPRNVF